MGRAAASRRRKPKAMISNTIAKITSTKGPKRNLLIDDSASEDSASVESSRRSRSSDESFIDNDEQEEDSCFHRICTWRSVFKTIHLQILYAIGESIMSTRTKTLVTTHTQ